MADNNTEETVARIMEAVKTAEYDALVETVQHWCNARAEEKAGEANCSGREAQIELLLRHCGLEEQDIIEDILATQAEHELIQRRDEKRGLYPNKIDDSN